MDHTWPRLLVPDPQEAQQNSDFCLTFSDSRHIVSYKSDTVLGAECTAGNNTSRKGALLGQMGSSKAGAGTRGLQARSSPLPAVVNELLGTPPRLFLYVVLWVIL